MKLIQPPFLSSLGVGFVTYDIGLVACPVCQEVFCIDHTKLKTKNRHRLENRTMYGYGDIYGTNDIGFPYLSPEEIRADKDASYGNIVCPICSEAYKLIHINKKEHELKKIEATVHTLNDFVGAW